MVINFMKFKDENVLRQALEQQLKVGLTTIDEVLLFCKENKLEYSGPIKTRPNDPERIQKHEATIYCSTRAPANRLQRMFSDWKNIVFFWGLFFLFATWTMRFYIDNEILSDIEVDLVYTWF